MGAPLVFYFDFISPYAYLAWTRIHAIAERNGRTVDIAPVLFAALLDAHGTKGPAEIPAKRTYTFKDVWRKAQRLGIGRLVPPPSHPFNPLLALRVASLPMDDADRRRIVDALYAATWKTGAGIDTEERVGLALRAAGIDAEALVARAKEPDAKARLRARTDEALARGAFGVPTVWADGEIFWGTDGVDLVEPFLRGEIALPGDLSWADRPASAVRPKSNER